MIGNDVIKFPWNIYKFLQYFLNSISFRYLFMPAAKPHMPPFPLTILLPVALYPAAYSVATHQPASPQLHLAPRNRRRLLASPLHLTCLHCDLSTSTSFHHAVASWLLLCIYLFIHRQQRHRRLALSDTRITPSLSALVQSTLKRHHGSLERTHNPKHLPS